MTGQYKIISNSKLDRLNVVLKKLVGLKELFNQGGMSESLLNSNIEELLRSHLSTTNSEVDRLTVILKELLDFRELFNQGDMTESLLNSEVQELLSTHLSNITGQNSLEIQGLLVTLFKEITSDKIKMNLLEKISQIKTEISAIPGTFDKSGDPFDEDSFKNLYILVKDNKSKKDQAEFKKLKLGKNLSNSVFNTLIREGILNKQGNIVDPSANFQETMIPIPSESDGLTASDAKIIKQFRREILYALRANKVTHEEKVNVVLRKLAELFTSYGFTMKVYKINNFGDKINKQPVFIHGMYSKEKGEIKFSPTFESRFNQIDSKTGKIKLRTLSKKIDEAFTDLSKAKNIKVLLVEDQASTIHAADSPAKQSPFIAATIRGDFNHFYVKLEKDSNNTLNQCCFESPEILTDLFLTASNVTKIIDESAKTDEANRSNLALVRQLQKRATIDRNSGALTRHNVIDRFAQYWALEAMNNQQPISVALIDLDKFKNVSTALSRQVANRVVIHLATLFKQIWTNNHDLVASMFGADEYLLAQHITKKEAAERIDYARLRGINEPWSIRVPALLDNTKEITILTSIFNVLDQLLDLKKGILEKSLHDLKSAEKVEQEKEKKDLIKEEALFLKKSPHTSVKTKGEIEKLETKLAGKLSENQKNSIRKKIKTLKAREKEESTQEKQALFKHLESISKKGLKPSEKTAKKIDNIKTRLKNIFEEISETDIIQYFETPGFEFDFSGNNNFKEFTSHIVRIIRDNPHLKITNKNQRAKLLKSINDELDGKYGKHLVTLKLKYNFSAGVVQLNHDNLNEVFMRMEDKWGADLVNRNKKFEAFLTHTAEFLIGHADKRQIASKASGRGHTTIQNGEDDNFNIVDDLFSTYREQ
jgi:GGDEF domain-containing protein